MHILAIDPGNVESAYVVYETQTRELLKFGKVLNEELVDLIEQGEVVYDCDYLAIEMPACYGMAVGQTVFDTCRWVGIFQQAFYREGTKLVYRKSQNKVDNIESVTMHLCHSTRAKDKNVRQAILDLYPATGGGKCPQVGTKGQPGPLYGVSADVWAALGVAITITETWKGITDGR